jgi:carboxymethylenebutenolidase
MLRDDMKSEFNSMLPGDSTEAGATRRTALKVALGVGYAAAVLPIAAQTAIKTSADGLTVGEVTIDVNGFKMPAYRAAPAGKSNLPVVLVVHEIFGVNDYIADVCRRFAKAGYLAISPELYARQGDPSQYGEVAKLMSELVSKVGDAQVAGDLDACLDWAGANGGDAKRAGITGFCWGGRQVWLYTAHSPRIRAGVAWYGRLVGASSALTPKNPIDLAANLDGPVLGLYGGKDGGIPLDTLQQMKAALAQGNAASKASEFVVYPEVGHAFHADYRPSYNQAAADDGFKRCLAWFKKNEVA